jgi:uncharacterized protein (UPF0332 family)
MNAAEFISLAESMLQDESTSARSRSIISRAYYGAFHLATLFLREQGLSTGANHGHLHHDYQSSDSPIGGRIGTMLQELYSLRVDADYRLQKTNVESRRLTVHSVVAARKVVEWITALRTEFEQNSESKSAFADAIVAYRRKVNRST